MTKHIPARLTAFRAGGADRYGVVDDGGFIDLTPEFGTTFPTLQAAIEAGRVEALVAGARGRAPDFATAEATFLVPLVRPGKIICVGVNFPDRNAEYRDGEAAPDHPSLFIRFPQSFVAHQENLVRPPESPQFDYEGEIALVIGKSGRRIPRDAAYEHVAAVTLCNEGTIRDWVRHAKFNVTQGKNWDRSGAIGPWLVPFRSADQLDDIRLVTRVNGEIRQDDRTSRMIHDFRALIAYVSTFTTLNPGDILVCGTPTGAGARRDPPVWLKPGDVIEVEVEGIGLLRNGVEDERC